MKKTILLALLTLTVATNAMANCDYAYDRAADGRNTRNAVITTTAAFGMLAGAIWLPGGNLFAAGYIVTLLKVAPETSRAKHNNFHDIISAAASAKKGEENKDLKRILDKAIWKTELEDTAEVRAKAAAILVEGYENGTFCPVVKVKKNGREVHAVFNKPALVQYLAEKL